MEKDLETINNKSGEEKVKQKRGRKPKTDKTIIKSDFENISISIETPIIKITKESKKEDKKVKKNISKKEQHNLQANEEK